MSAGALKSNRGLHLVHVVCGSREAGGQKLLLCIAVPRLLGLVT